MIAEYSQHTRHDGTRAKFKRNKIEHGGQVTIYLSTADHLDPNLPLSDAVWDMCLVQIQPRKHVPDHEGETPPTRQHELDHTDHTDQKQMTYMP